MLWALMLLLSSATVVYYLNPISSTKVSKESTGPHTIAEPRSCQESSFAGSTGIATSHTKLSSNERAGLTTALRESKLRSIYVYNMPVEHDELIYTWDVHADRIAAHLEESALLRMVLSGVPLGSTALTRHCPSVSRVSLGCNAFVAAKE